MSSTWISLYFITNLGLTLYNKGVLIHFPFPYTLTALHALCGSLGGRLLVEHGAYRPKRLAFQDEFVLVGFSILYTVNIAVSNLSLGLVTIPFHQVVRAATPMFTMMISYTLLHTRYSSPKLFSLLPVVVGVGFATYGDYYFTAWGLTLTLSGTFLAALKTVVTNILQSTNTGSATSSDLRTVHNSVMLSLRLQMSPLDLLTRMSPLAFIQCAIFAHLSGELQRVRRYSAHEMTAFKMSALLVNGFLAFALNIVSFTANKKVGALSMTVAANVKQVLAIASAIFLFNLSINLVNAIGISLTILGGAAYGYVDYYERQHAGPPKKS
ncbi:TPT-domain-containing protein [Rickenella mellea]|uniref:TPT-domain-containing protein n=1 Tax=Rickenella mellea TaxID=50990 RepID=A0A4Y7PYC5_9AGAM|nr:TPT-domain-containing protein [Rickenella mellea]